MAWQNQQNECAQCEDLDQPKHRLSITLLWHALNVLAKLSSRARYPTFEF